MFDKGLDSAVSSIWDELDARYGVSGVRAVPWPHVSFAVACGWDREAIVQAISASVRTLSAAPIRLEPWVLFTGSSAMHPAIVRAAVRSRPLDLLHGLIGDLVSHILEDPSPFTSTDRWNPHVTVATRDLTPRIAGDMMTWLAETDPPAWVGTVVRLACIESDLDGHRIVEEYTLADEIS